MPKKLLGSLLASALVWWAPAAEVEVCAGGADGLCGLGDSEALVQTSARSPWLDVYVTSAETVEDLMYWAVLYKSMKPYYHAHSHWLVIRPGSELMKRAHAIRMAIGDAYWHAMVDVFKPSNLNLESVDAKTWRQLAPFQYSPEKYRRVVHLDPDMLAFANIDNMTHQIPHMMLATDQGDCRNLTDALNSEKPATSLFSMVPDTQVMNLLTTATTLLAREAGPEGQGGKHANVTQAHLISRAFKKIHPERAQARIPPSQVVSASCLMHHKDSVLRNKGLTDSMQLLSLGGEGRQLINDIMAHGQKRLVSDLTNLVGANKTVLADAVRKWFQCFDSNDVRNILDAAKNGILAES